LDLHGIKHSNGIFSVLIAHYKFLIEYHFGMRNFRPKFNWNRGLEQKIIELAGRRPQLPLNQTGVTGPWFYCYIFGHRWN